MEIVFLGTGSMFPTEKRAHPSVFVRDTKLCFLFDCGEGVQRQMRIAGLSPTSIDYIFITHWHGDHALGIAGLIQSISSSSRKKQVTVFGPKGTKTKINYILKTYPFDLRFPLEVQDIDDSGSTVKKVIDNEEFRVEAMNVKHAIPCISYAYIKKGKRKINLEYTKKFGLVQDPILGKLQKGKTITYKGNKIAPEQGTFQMPDKKIVYITDTAYFKKLEKFAQNADLLISEGTFSEELGTKAKEYTHMTAADAAKIAKNASAKKLILTHFSQRYTDSSKLKAEAKKIFPETEAANDFDKFKI